MAPCPASPPPSPTYDRSRARRLRARRDGEVLHLHHVVAPSFFGAREIMMDLGTRQHKATTASPDTTILVAPAPVFRALVTSANATRAYQTSAKLTANLEARNKWYVAHDDPRGSQACCVQPVYPLAPQSTIPGTASARSRRVTPLRFRSRSWTTPK